jgi:hypothetical protein
MAKKAKKQEKQATLPAESPSKLLPMTLSAAVPLWIADFKTQSWESVQARFSETVKDLPELLGSRGDVLLFGGSKKGEAANLFNRLAEAIALMSFLPGGITTFGTTWESFHPDAQVQGPPS